MLIYDKMKRVYFQAVDMSEKYCVVCTLCNPTKHLEKEPDEKNTKMLCVVWNKSWKYPPPKKINYTTTYLSSNKPYVSLDEFTN